MEHTNRRGIWRAAITGAVVAAVAVGGAWAYSATAGAAGDIPTEVHAAANADGYRITVDGKEVPDIVVGSSVAKVRVLSEQNGVKLSDDDAARYAGAGAVLLSVLESIGRENSKPVTDADIEESLRDAVSIGDVFEGQAPERMSPEQLEERKREVLSNPEDRASLESGLYRSRGLAHVIGDKDLRDPKALEELSAQYAAELEARKVTAVTPAGELSVDELVNFGLNLGQGGFAF